MIIGVLHGMLPVGLLAVLYVVLLGVLHGMLKWCAPCSALGSVLLGVFRGMRTWCAPCCL